MKKTEYKVGVSSSRRGWWHVWIGEAIVNAPDWDKYLTVTSFTVPTRWLAHKLADLEISYQHGKDRRAQRRSEREKRTSHALYRYKP